MAAKKKTTAKKTTKPKKIKIMYSPVGFTAEHMNFPLKRKESKNMNGRIVLVNVPRIEGLPMDLEFSKGQVLEVTPEQLQQLQDLKIVETEEEHERRVNFIKNLPNQYPETLSEVEKAERKSQLLSAWDSQNKIYNDKLIICD